MIANRKHLIEGKSQVVAGMRLQAARFIWTGRDTAADLFTLASCSRIHKESGTRLIFTRDEGYHSSGWWKNPDYERCFHLSLSFVGVSGDEVFLLPKSRRLTEEWITLFFGPDKGLLWAEPPYSREGKASDIWHYRLFCTPDWKPFKPSGEVYDRTWTPRGWKSFSDLAHEAPQLSRNA